MVRHFIAGTALGLALAGGSAVQAADVSAPPAYDWSGAYIGLNAGAAWNDTDINNNLVSKAAQADASIHDFTADQTAFTGGAMVGYNYQIDQLVLGAEADFNYLGFSQEDTRKFVIVSEGRSNDITDRISFDANWFGTVRGRLGFAIDNLLLYGTGGLAYGHISLDHSFVGERPDQTIRLDGSADSVNWGWTLGAGAEYGFDRWSLGVEYLYADLGTADWETNTAITAHNRDVTNKGTADWQFSVVRATAKIRF